MPRNRNLWVLPDGVNEITQDLAMPLENLRRKIVDEFKVWGYDLVFPPLIEFLESLLTGSSHELDLQTFKLTDQLSGRLMGVRADMTPQMARIDSHVRKKDVPDRLCYIGPVLRAKTHGVSGSRTPIQLGAELFGHKGLASDGEIVNLMIRVLQLTGLDEFYLDIGHVGIFRALVRQADLEEDAQIRLRDILQRKASGELDEFLSNNNIDSDLGQKLLALPMLCGGTKVIEEARAILGGKNKEIVTALDEMAELASMINRIGGVKTVFDLAELRGYSYHTGLVFAAYTDNKGSAIAKGGRYDEIGKVFGRARPATGFSADLVELVRLSSVRYQKRAIFAPATDDAKLKKRVAKLRAAGEEVVCELPGQSADKTDLGCNRELKLINGSWRVEDV